MSRKQFGGKDIGPEGVVFAKGDLFHKLTRSSKVSTAYVFF